MGSIRARKDTGMLFFDFIFKGMRCRELTTLKDSAENRRTMEKLIKKIDAEILLDQFEYARYFPSSLVVKKLAVEQARLALGETGEGGNVLSTPLLKDFAEEWLEENVVRWKRSYEDMVTLVIEKYLVPKFGEMEVSRINKGEILKFRASLAKVQHGDKIGLTPDRINHIMTPLRMILADAADRNNFTTPFTGIKQLRVPRTEVDPFSLEEVKRFIANVRSDYLNYYIVRFMTGMRTSEIDGLKWKYVNFERREIFIRETLVKGTVETTKTPESTRSIDMSDSVYSALQSQYAATKHLSDFVFCTKEGSPLQYSNVSNRVWYPTLELLDLRPRRPYQTRHTTATLWLAAGENPEWIARQMGHTTTRMLFTVYSRFVPNLTRRDGSAFETLVTNSRVFETAGGAP